MEKAAKKLAHTKEALQKIKNGASIRSISKEYGIPRSTLFDKLNGRAPIEIYSRAELHPAEEEGLVNWIKGMEERGFGRERGLILAQTKKLLDAKGRKTRFIDNMPGKDWWYSFIKRHPELKFTCEDPMQLLKQRAPAKPGLVIAGMFSLPLNPSQVADSLKLKRCQLSTASPITGTTPSYFVEGTPSYRLNALDLAGSALPRKVPCYCKGCKCPSTPTIAAQTSQPQTTHAHASPVPFTNIFPQVVPPTKSKKNKEVIPKVCTGRRFRKIMEEKKNKKENVQKAREEKKRVREEKKRKADEDKQKKKEERENKKRRKISLVQQIKREMDDDGDGGIGQININICAKCDVPFLIEETRDCIGCNKCPRWFHRRCIDANLVAMTDEEIKEYYLECLYC